MQYHYFKSKNKSSNHLNLNITYNYKLPLHIGARAMVIGGVGLSVRVSHFGFKRIT